MDTPQDERITSTGERPVTTDNWTEQYQPLSPKDERIVSANPSPDAATLGTARDVTKQLESSDAVRDLSAGLSLNVNAAHEQNQQYGGYDNSNGNWDGYSHFYNADGLQIVSPVIYNDNPSLVFHSGYGFSSEMAYGQYSHVGTSLPSIMLDGQLYPPQQVPFSPPYYPQPASQSLPHISSAVPVSPAKLLTAESSSNDSMLFGPGSSYFMHLGSFGGGNLSGHPGLGHVTSPSAYPQPMGILGSYEHNIGQVSHHQRPLQPLGLVPNSPSGRYPHAGSYQSSNLGSAFSSYSGANDRIRLTLDKGRGRERDRDSIFISNELHDISIDPNRGPRASKLKGKSTAEQSSSSGFSRKKASGILFDTYNGVDFVTDYANAKFYIIKSFSEDNVHKSIKYKVWASTPHGNKKLDAAYHEAKEIEGNCPVFLLFSVNASGQFCGVAEMVGPVDFGKDADYWQQDRWSGQFPVRWHIIKDVPNSQFRHILLANNENKPVTHSRDSQEVRLQQGVEMLKIFKAHNARTSIVDDFDFYDEREKSLKEKKAKQRANSKIDSVESPGDDSMNQISRSFSQALQLEKSNKEVQANEMGASLRTDAAISLAHDSVSQNLDSFSQILQLEDTNNVTATEMSGGHQN